MKEVIRLDFTAIKKLRKKKNLTQAELSTMSGIGRVTISRLESGVLRESSASTLLSIAQALDCSVDDIVKNFNKNL